MKNWHKTLNATIHKFQTFNVKVYGYKMRMHHGKPVTYALYKFTNDSQIKLRESPVRLDAECKPYIMIGHEKTFVELLHD